MTWTDIGGEGIVRAGDSLTITRPGRLPLSTTFTFYLLRSDGSQTASVTWAT